MFNEWYLARDSSHYFVVAYPTQLTGITKHKGCICYKPTHFFNRKVIGYVNFPMELTRASCKAIFGHCPRSGELLCVKHKRDGTWSAEKIDLEFS